MSVTDQTNDVVETLCHDLLESWINWSWLTGILFAKYAEFVKKKICRICKICNWIMKNMPKMSVISQSLSSLTEAAVDNWMNWFLLVRILINWICCWLSEFDVTVALLKKLPTACISCQRCVKAVKSLLKQWKLLKTCFGYQSCWLHVRAVKAVDSW